MVVNVVKFKVPEVAEYWMVLPVIVLIADVGVNAFLMSIIPAAAHVLLVLLLLVMSLLQVKQEITIFSL